MSVENQAPLSRIVFDDEETIYDIVGMLNAEKVKKKKNKKPREEYLTSTGKPRVIKKPSIVAETASDLIRLGYKTPGKIAEYFSDKGRILDEQQKRLYLLLVKSKVSLGKFILSDDLANSPVHIYLLISDFKTKVISNDWLWLALAFSRAIDGETKNAGFLVGDQITEGIFRSALIKDVQMVSSSFKCKKDVEKGYYQDYLTNFACIGMDKMSRNDIKDVLQKGEKYEFKYYGYEFIARGQSGECVIYNKTDNLTEQTIEDRIKACKVVSIDERRPKLKEKIIEIKNDVVRFIGSTVKPEKFCPAFLRTDELVRYRFLITASLDYNDLFRYMDLSVTTHKKLIFYDNAWYWDNTESWFEFLTIYSITTQSKDLSREAKNKLVEYCDFYYRYQDFILALKKNQLALQRIYSDFYNSFTSKINYDKAKSLLKRVREYIGFRDFLMRDDSYAAVVSWVNSLNFCTFIKNQLRTDIMKIADSMLDCLADLIDNRSSTENLVGSFKRVAELIYYACPNEVKHSGFVPSFPLIFSAGGFLGYLFEKNEAKDVIALNLKKIENQVGNVNQKTEKIVNAFGDLFENMEQYRKNVIKANILKFADEEDVKFGKEELEKLIVDILSEFVKNEGYNNALNKGIYNAIKNGKSLDNLIVEQSGFVNYIKSQVAKKKSQINQIKRENNEIQERIDNLQQRKAENQNIIDNQLSGSFINVKRGKRDEDDTSSISSNYTETDLQVLNKGKFSNFERFNELLKTKKPEDPYLSKYYSAIAYMSGVYPKEFPEATSNSKMTAKALKQKYPLRPAVFEVVVADSGIPDASYTEIKNWADKSPVLFKKQNTDYNDENVLKRLMNTYFGM